MASTELQNKLNTAYRYAGTTGGTLLTVLGAFAFLSPEQIVEVKAQIDVLNTSLLTAYGALTKMWIILGPIGIAVLAKMGWNSSGIQALGEKLFSIAKHDDKAKEVLVTAAAAPEMGTTAIVNPTMAASPATPSNVVVSAAVAAQLPPAPVPAQP